MLGSMKYGTYIFFAAFSGMGGVFVYFLVPETKDKTLEELDVYFGADKDSIAVADRERMDRINERLGLTGVEDVNQLAGKSTPEKPGIESADDNYVPVNEKVD